MAGRPLEDVIFQRKVRALPERCPLTAGRGNPTESATEIYRCNYSKGEKVR